MYRRSRLRLLIVHLGRLSRTEKWQTWKITDLVVLVRSTDEACNGVKYRLDWTWSFVQQRVPWCSGLTGLWQKRGQCLGGLVVQWVTVKLVEVGEASRIMLHWKHVIQAAGRTRRSHGPTPWEYPNQSAVLYCGRSNRLPAIMLHKICLSIRWINVQVFLFIFYCLSFVPVCCVALRIFYALLRRNKR